MSLLFSAVAAFTEDPPADLDPSTGKGPEWGKAAPIGLLVILLMVIATYFLLRSMVRKINKVPANFDPPAAAADEIAPDDSAFDDFAPDDAGFDDAAFDESGLDGSARDGSALDGPASDGSAMDDPALDGSARDGSARDGSVRDEPARDA